MQEINWSTEHPTPWLLTGRSAGDDVVAGVTFGVGLLHQPTPQLGVAGLFAAWLTASLSRPVEAAAAPGARLKFQLGQLESSLVVAGPEQAVRGVLQRMDQLIAEPPGAELDGSMVDRSRAYANPLSVWRSHLAARWPGHRPHLSALGPLALSTLDSAALHAFVTDCVAPAARVCWTNEPRLVDAVGGPTGHRPAGPAAPTGSRAEPGCVVQSAAGEMFSIAVPQASATDIALTLLLGGLHRRMVEFEPLATDVNIAAHRVGGGLLLACGGAAVLPGKDDQARTAIVQTVEDLASGFGRVAEEGGGVSVAEEQIARVRRMMADGERAAGADLVGTMSALARRHLARGDLPTPESVAREYDEVADDQVRTALAGFLPQLLLAVPQQQALTDPPFPMAERVLLDPPAGSRFPDRITKRRVVRCSPERVAIVDTVATGRHWRTTRQVTRASVSFDEVVLRLDAGDYATILVDQQFYLVELVWDSYRRADRLRELVDRGVGAVPVIRQQPDPDAVDRTRALVRRHVRRTALAGAGTAALAAALVGLIAYGVTHDLEPTVRTVDPGATVRLANGTTLSIVDGPEMVEHYNRSITNVYGVQMRVCAGREYSDKSKYDSQPDFGEARNYFGAEKFRLQIGEESFQSLNGLGSFNAVQERPSPPGDYIDSGDCATGWLLFRLPTPTLERAPMLLYSNIDDDRITWRLPATAARSELSKPCPSPTPDLSGNLVDPGWVGCPTPPTR